MLWDSIWAFGVALLMNGLAAIGIISLLVLELPRLWVANWEDRLERGLGKFRPFATPSAILLLFVGAFIAFNDERVARIEAEGLPNRANLVVKPGPVYNVKGPNSITAYTIFENVGNTPARDMRWKVWLNVLDDSQVVRRCENLGEEPNLLGGPMDLAQHDEIGKHVVRPWGAAEIEDVAVSRKHIYLCGQVSYLDEFANSHGLPFCYRYSGSNTARLSVPSGVNIGYPDTEYDTCPDFVGHGTR